MPFKALLSPTSANPAGLPPARSLQDANHYFAQQVNYLNGDLGLSQEPSRILDAETGGQWLVLKSVLFLRIFTEK